VICGSAAWSAEPQITASVSPQAVVVGAQVVYNVSIKVGDAAAMRNQGPALRGAPACPLLRMMTARPSSQRQVQIINGEYNQSYELTWRMQATQEGDGQITGLQIEIGGQVYPVQPVAIKVAKSAEDTLPPSLRSGDLLPATSGDAGVDKELRGRLFASLTFSKTDVYLQEPIVVDCIVYADGIEGALIERGFGWKPEGLKDFVVGETKFADPGWRRGTLGGRQYSVRTVARYYMVPTRVGEIEIPLTNAMCQVQVKTSDPFFGNDPLFGNIMGAAQAVPVSMPVRGTKIRVKPLPTQGQPPSFRNAVGNFTFAARVNTQEMSEDDLLTLTFEIGGTGYLGSITEPALPDLKDWKVTGKPSEKVEGSKENSLFEGKKVFEYVLRPARSGALEVPQIAYGFFSPEQNRYMEVQRGPFKVNVAKGKQRQLQVATSTVSSDSPNQPAATVSATPEQLAYLHTPLPSALTVIPFYRQSAFPLLLTLPVVLLGVALGFRGWTEYRTRHQGEFAVRQAGGRARKELKTARASLKAGQLDAFHSQLAEALRGYIATKIQRSAKGLTFEEIQEACEARGLNAEKTRSLRRVLERCDGARYHSGGGDAAAAEDLLREAETLLDAMDQVFG
jgi:hypothetical protein